jgi:hypothetical protein
MNWAEIVALIVSGFLVGFINTLAGGGTIITVSLLLFLGLPATVANGTNRVAVVFQTLVAVISFRKQKLLDTRKGLGFSVPTVLGSVLGAMIAARFEESMMQKVIALVMIMMLFFILYKPERWLKSRPDLIEKRISVFQLVVFFLIGFYGGFIHMGVGFFLIAFLVMSGGYDLVKANAIKNLIVLAYAPFALVVFMFNGQVNYKYGLIISIGNVGGAWLASHFAVNKGANFIRWVIVAVIIITTLQLFGIINFKDIFSAIL